ncbi:MAG: EVE domain-containing protein [Candidatus Moranbacteria bacterium]|nr:EVE domain-containing protein [Candidatus Moranbacteria bacterium]
MNVWIFQFNPDRFNALSTMYDKEEHHWTVNQYLNHIRKGDICMIWRAGKPDVRGIYALGKIVTNPEYIVDPGEESKGWTNAVDRNHRNMRVKYIFIKKLIDDPILIGAIKNQPELQNLAIIRQPQCSNSPVTPSEWAVLADMIENR